MTRWHRFLDAFIASKRLENRMSERSEEAYRHVITRFFTDTARIRAAYDRIRAVSVTALLPGAFGAKVARAQHSHDLLLALAEELEAQAAHLEGRK